MSLERAVAELRSEVERRFGELAGALQRLTEAQRRTEEELVTLAARVDALAARIDALVGAQRRHYEEFAAYRAETDRRFGELAEAQRRTEERLAEVAEQVAALTRELRAIAGTAGDLLGWRLEANVRERPYAYVRRVLSPVRVLSEA